MNTLPTTHDSNTPTSIDLLHNRDTLPQPSFLNRMPPISKAIELNALAIISTAKKRWKQIERISDNVANIVLRFTFSSRNQTHNQRRGLLAIAFALANLSSTLLYYAFKYSPKGTIKPSWSEMLG